MLDTDACAVDFFRPVARSSGTASPSPQCVWQQKADYHSSKVWSPQTGIVRRLPFHCEKPQLSLSPEVHPAYTANELNIAMPMD